MANGVMLESLRQAKVTGKTEIIFKLLIFDCVHISQVKKNTMLLQPKKGK